MASSAKLLPCRSGDDLRTEEGGPESGKDPIKERSSRHSPIKAALTESFPPPCVFSATLKRLPQASEDRNQESFSWLHELWLKAQFQGSGIAVRTGIPECKEMSHRVALRQ